MMISFDEKRFEIKEFFSYPCTVCERIIEYKMDSIHGDSDVKDFFNSCLNASEKKSRKNHLMDNKIAMKVYDNKTGNTFYIGYKDNIYAIGLCLNPYMKSTYTIKFDK